MKDVSVFKAICPVPTLQHAARWYRHIAPVVAKMHEVDRFSARLCTLPGVYENLIPGASSASGKAEAKGPDPRPRRRGQQRPTLVGVEVGRELGDAAGGVGAAAAKDPQRVQDFRVQIGAPDPCGVSKSILPGGFGGRRLQVYLLLQLPSRARNIRTPSTRGDGAEQVLLSFWFGHYLCSAAAGSTR